MKLHRPKPRNAPTIAPRVPRKIERALTKQAAATSAHRSVIIREAPAAYLADSEDVSPRNDRASSSRSRCASRC